MIGSKIFGILNVKNLLIAIIVGLATSIGLMVYYYQTDTDDGLLLATIFSLSPVFGGVIGSLIAYVLLTDKERRNADAFKTKVTKGIIHELSVYYDVLESLVRLDQSSASETYEFSIPFSSEGYKKLEVMEDYNAKFYGALDAETKVKALDVETFIKLEQLYGDFRAGKLQMHRGELTIFVNRVEAEKMKERIFDLLNLLN